MSEEGTPVSETAPTQEAPSSDAMLELAKMSEQAEKFKNDYLYLRAEFDNYKRHAIKDRAELLKYGGERLVRDLLDVLDNFERALQVKLTPDTIDTFHKGIEMTAVALKEVLEKNGIFQINSEGQPFDPNMHEALSSEPTTSVPPGHISRVFKKPYKFHEKMIRPGQVIVAQKPE